MMTLRVYFEGRQVAQVAVDSRGEVGTTGDGERIVAGTKVLGGKALGWRELTPADGEAWLRGLAEEVGRSGYYRVTLDA